MATTSSDPKTGYAHHDTTNPGDEATSFLPANRQKKSKGFGPLTRTARKLGWIPIQLLLSSSFGVLLFVAYISFLWFSADENPKWRSIAGSGWVVKSITLASLLLRTATGIQTGLATSMMAAIALEGPGVLLSSLATVSTMRGQGASLHTLLPHLFGSTFNAHIKHRRNWVLFLLALQLSASTLLLQFTSTMLLSNVGAGYISGPIVARNVTELWVNGLPSLVGKWTKQPRLYPSFAEYMEESNLDPRKGASDTGIVMRAFLPISNQQTRYALRQYEGPASVVDTRVVCVRPNITNLRAEDRPTGFGFPIIKGNLTIPSDLDVDPLNSQGQSRLAIQGSVGFTCSVSEGHPTLSSQWHTSSWNMSVCQLHNAAGYLIPDWYEYEKPTEGPWPVTEKWNGGWMWPDKRTLSGRNYLAVNFTVSEPIMNIITGHFETTLESQHAYEKASQDFKDLFDSSTPGLAHRNRNEWQDIYRDNGTYNAETAMLSFSLCLPSFGSKTLRISATSSANRTEPWFQSTHKYGSFDFERIRKQLVPSPSITHSERGILALKHQDWAGQEALPVLSPDFVDIGWAMTLPSEHDTTIHLVRPKGNPLDNTVRASFSIAGVALEILRTGGSIAQAIQSMLYTTVASAHDDMFYPEGHSLSLQDYLGDNPVVIGWNSSQSVFIPVQVPGGIGGLAEHAAGVTWQYLIVMMAVCVHFAVVCVVCFWFVTGTVTSTLWNSWRNVAQIVTPATSGYLERASLASDNQVKEWIQHDGLQRTTVNVLLDEGKEGTQIKARRRNAPWR